MVVDFYCNSLVALSSTLSEATESMSSLMDCLYLSYVHTRSELFLVSYSSLF